MARVPALGALNIRCKRVGCGVIGKLGVRPSVRVWESPYILFDERDGFQRVGHGGGAVSCLGSPADMRADQQQGLLKKFPSSHIRDAPGTEFCEKGCVAKTENVACGFRLSGMSG